MRVAGETPYHDVPHAILGSFLRFMPTREPFPGSETPWKKERLAAMALSHARLRLLRFPLSPSCGTLRTPPEPSSVPSVPRTTQSLSVHARNLIVSCTLDMGTSFFPNLVSRGNKSLRSATNLVQCKDAVTLASTDIFS